MDYSSYFATTPQALQFFALPPTPSYSEEKLDQAVDTVDAAFFPPYDFRFSQPQAQIPGQHPQGSASQASPLVSASGAAADASPTAMSGPGLPMGSVESGMGVDGLGGMQGNEDASQGRTRSSSEEKESLTPAQSRRKAQNRAAQRAFRERKERHVRDLEAKLSALESSATTLATDNERLKLALQRATTENEILRATSTSAHRLSVGSSMDGSEGGIRTLGAVMSPTLSTHSDTSAGTAVAAAQALLARSDGTSGPGVFGVTNEDSRAADALAGGAGMNGDGAASGSSIGPNPSHNPLFSAAAASTSSPLNSFAPPASRASSAFLPAAATWDLIQAHPLVKRGVVDIADVCEALRGTARCDGQGPVFREEMVWRAVESARRGGGDELI